MPVTLSRADRRLLLSAGGVFVVLITATLVLTAGAGDTTENPSSSSAGSTGAKAAYLLLQASGYRVDRWQQPPGELTDPAHTTLILAEPLELPTHDEQLAIQQFLGHGGRVIATGRIGAEFLSTVVEPDPVGAVMWKRVTALSPSAVTRSAPAITIAPVASWEDRFFAVPLYGDADAPVVVHFSVGTGDAYWWAAATPLTNAGVREPGNLEFFLACLGPADGRRVLWDEYVHGSRRSLAGSMWHSPVKWVLAQVGALGIAILLTYARRSGPIVLPASISRLSPLEFVQTLGSLYQRAGASSVAVRIAYQRFRHALTRRLGLTHRASVEELERAVANRWTIDPAGLDATLRACESVRDGAALDPKAALVLIQSLDDQARALQIFGMTIKEKT